MKNSIRTTSLILSIAALFMTSCTSGKNAASSDGSSSNVASSMTGSSSQGGTSSSKEETSSSASIPSSSSSSSSSISSSSSSDSSSSSSTSSSEETPLDPAALLAAQNQAFSEIDDCLNQLDRDDYAKARYEKIIALVNQGKSAIILSHSQVRIDTVVTETITAIGQVITMAQAVAGTLFCVSTGKYDLDKDDETGHLLISYQDWPGDWSYVGNADYSNNLAVDLGHNPALANYFRLKLHNTGDQAMYVMMKMDNAEATSSSNYYSASSEIVTLEKDASIDLTLSLAKKVDYLHFYVDSTNIEDSHPRHSGAGQVEIVSYGFEKVGGDEPTIVNGTGILAPYCQVGAGSPFQYNLGLVKDVDKVWRLRFVLSIDFNGAANDKQYWGGNVTVGGVSTSYANAGYCDKVDANGDKVADSVTQYFNVEVSGLTSTDTLGFSFDYCGGEFKATLQEVDFYYDDGLTYTEKNVVTNHVVFGTDKSDLEIPYSSFASSGTVKKLVINVTSTSNQTYVGGTFYIKGITFSSSQLAQFGYTMKPGAEGSGSVVIYPTSAVDLTSSGGKFTIACWWAPASVVTITSVSLFVA